MKCLVLALSEKDRLQKDGNNVEPLTANAKRGKNFGMAHTILGLPRKIQKR